MNASRCWLVVAGLLGAAGVGLGAYGAHGLEKRVIAVVVGDADAAKNGVVSEAEQNAIAERIENWKTAAHYQMIHVAALLAIGLATGRWPSRLWCLSGAAMLLGMGMFSGVLYYRALSPDPRFGIVVMFGGISYIVGWLTFSAAAALAEFRGEQNRDGRLHVAKRLRLWSK